MSDFGQRLRDAVDHFKHRHSTGDVPDFGPLDQLVSEANGGGVQPSAAAPETVAPAPAPEPKPEPAAVKSEPAEPEADKAAE